MAIRWRKKTLTTNLSKGCTATEFTPTLVLTVAMRKDIYANGKQNRAFKFFMCVIFGDFTFFSHFTLLWRMVLACESAGYVLEIQLHDTQSRNLKESCTLYKEDPEQYKE